MSKRLGNVIDPFETIGQFGADATRWYLITNASPWDNLKFDIEGIREVQRKFFGTLYNTYQFFSLYANVDGFAYREASIPLPERPEIDRWIISTLNSLVKTVQKHMDDYEPTLAGRAVEEFVDSQLSNWYVRLCRRRFWKGEYEQDKISAYQTLLECLETVIKLIAPISPFFSDAIFRNLNAVTQRETVKSVHHLRFPEFNPVLADADLEERMKLAQDACSLMLSIRKKVNIRVRQPLQKALIPILDPAMRLHLEQVEELIKAEVNIKEIEYISGDNDFIRKKVKPNFVMLGKKLGAKMKAVSVMLTSLSQSQIRVLENAGMIELIVDDESVVIFLSEVEVQSEDVPGWIVASRNSLTVALDIQISGELEEEGNARELVNRIQKIRKDSGFELTDRIMVKISSDERLNPSFSRFKNYICAEILADGLDIEPLLSEGVETEVNEIHLKILVSKKG
jgi:isoleucyl-tRNA synthetase